jgi:hypothetical protein
LFTPSRIARLAATLLGVLALPAFALPTVSLTAPAAGATFANPASITISANATPTSGRTITKVEFYRGGSTLIATVNAPGPYTTVWNHAVNGTYSLTAKAYDATGSRTSSARSITIATISPPTVALSAPANGATFAAIASITVSATASASAGATISRVEFYNGSTLIASDTSSPYSVTWTGVTAGTYTIKARAIDSRGMTTDSGTRTITVTAPPPPTVSLTSPSPGATFTPPANIALAATATPGSGATISKVEFFNGSTLLGQDTTSPYTFAWNGVAAGAYSLTAKATDNKGSSTTTAPVNVTVAAPTPPPSVSLTLPSANSVATAPATLQIAASASASAPATIARVEFRAGTTLLAAPTVPPYAFEWTGIPSGGYAITATAVDSLGKSTVSEAKYLAVDGADSCATTPPLAEAGRATALATLERLPLTFEENRGQAHGAVRYLARGPGYQLFLTPAERVLALPAANRREAPARGESDPVAIRLRLLGANDSPLVRGEQPLARRSHYLAGRDPSSWRTHVPHFARVRYENLYPGIDEVLYGREGSLEYDFVVAPGADPRRIRFAVEGARRLFLDDAGDLVMETVGGRLVQKRPVAYQEIDGERRPVDARYRLLASRQVGFALGRYDRARPLVIDPVLVYSTYLGAAGNGSGINAIALSRCGEAFVAGWTYAADFPTTAGAPRRTAPPGDPLMGFVAKLDPAGTGILHSTYLTGSVLDYGDGFPQAQGSEATTLAVDATGHAYVGGHTTATDFPTTPGAWYAASLAPGATLGFLVRLNTDGTGLAYGTYVPAPLEGLAVDAAGSAYAVGGRNLWKLSADGAMPLYEYLLGGSGFTLPDQAQAVAVDAAGHAFVAGNTYSMDLPVTPGAFQPTMPSPNNASRAAAFVTKVNPSGTGAVYTTYLGNAGQAYPSGIALDAAGNAYVSGWVTDSTTIPNYAGAVTSFGNGNPNSGNIHAFVAKLNAAGSGLAYFTRLGGSRCVNSFCSASQTRANGIAVDATGATWVAGLTGATQIPMVKSLQATPFGSGADIFAAKLSPDGASLLYSTYLHGTATADGPPNGVGTPIANGIAVDVVGSVYVAGITDQSGFPTTAGAFQGVIPIGASGFVTKINESKDTTTTLAITPNPSAVGTTTTLAATIAGNAPTGTVTFMDGAATLGSVAVAGASAQLATTALGAGVHSISASYGGDARNNASQSSPVTLNVADPVTPPTVTLTGIADGAMFMASAAGTYSGASVTLNAAAAAGNQLTQVRIYLDGGYQFWNVTGATAFQPWSLPALAPGVHILFASALDNQGHTTFTPAIRFIVNPNGATPPTAVVLTAPLEGATFIAPETIAMAAGATPASGKSIASIAYYANGAMKDIGNASPFGGNWFNSEPGAYSLRAVATDNAGGMAFSPPVTVTVGPAQPPTVAITTPATGASYTSPATVSITASATAAAGAGIAKVEFLQGTAVVGTVTSSPYTFEWTGVAQGDYSLTARATDTRTSKATSTAVAITVGAAPSLAITPTAGLDGSTVTGDSVVVTGTILAPPNSGVTVNGILATVSASGYFLVNDVPLSAGANTITLVVTTQDGATASRAITVSASGTAAPFTVSVDEPDGIAPHTVTFTLGGGGGTPVGSVEIDVDGNGTVDITSPGMPAAGVQATYNGAGLASPRFTFKDAAGTVIYTTSRQVHIEDPVVKYNLLKGVYTDVVARLSAGNGTAASGLFIESQRTGYQEFFGQIGSNLASVAGQLGQLRGGTISGNRGELVVVRETSEGLTAFTINVIRGADGIWRVESM